MPGIEPGPLGWYTGALTTGLQEVRLRVRFEGEGWLPFIKLG